MMLQMACSSCDGPGRSVLLLINLSIERKRQRLVFDHVKLLITGRSGQKNTFFETKKKLPFYPV